MQGGGRGSGGDIWNSLGGWGKEGNCEDDTSSWTVFGSVLFYL